MIKPNDPAFPAGVWGQQTNTGVPIILHLAANIAAGISSQYQDPHLCAKHSIEIAECLIHQFNNKYSTT